MLSQNPFYLFCALLLCLLPLLFYIKFPYNSSFFITHPITQHRIVSINRLNDTELLKWASRVNPNPGKGPKKIAFMFLTTTTPLQFALIWEKFFIESQEHYNIYIHTDPKQNPEDYNLTGLFTGRVIPSSQPTARNTPTLVAAARRLLSHALLDDPNNYMFTLLSSACIPLHSFNFTYSKLISSEKSFIEILANESNAYSRWAARGEHAMLPEVPLDVFRIGSQFWTLTRPHARVVVKDVILWRKFRAECVDTRVCFPEENYFPTLLNMKVPRGVVPATLTNVNWAGGENGHPKMYNGSEVDIGLIQRLRNEKPRYGEMGMEMDGGDLSIRNDSFLFARKFDISCLDVLLNLTHNFLFKD